MGKSSSEWFRKWLRRLDMAELEQCEMWIVAEIGDRIYAEKHPFDVEAERVPLGVV